MKLVDPNLTMTTNATTNDDEDMIIKCDDVEHVTIKPEPLSPHTYDAPSTAMSSSLSSATVQSSPNVTSAFSKVAQTFVVTCTTKPVNRQPTTIILTRNPAGQAGAFHSSVQPSNSIRTECAAAVTVKPVVKTKFVDVVGQSGTDATASQYKRKSENLEIVNNFTI